MLSITLIPEGRTAKYYAGYQGRGAYLTVFLGSGARARGCEGKAVDPKVAENFFRGFDETGKRRIAQIQKYKGRASHSPGWDITVTLGKSYSVLRAVSDANTGKQFDQGVIESCKELVDYLESIAALSRRGKGGSYLEKCGLLVAAYVHLENRNGEPNYHVHLVVFNLAYRPSDRTWGTLRSYPLYIHKMAGGAFWRSTAAEKLSHLGIISRKRKRKDGRPADSFRVVGVPQRVCNALSSRRREIKADLLARGEYGAKAAADAALRTRARKQNILPEALFARWRGEISKLGFSPSRAKALFAAGAFVPNAPRAIVEKRLKRSLTRAVRDLTLHESTFFERDVLRYAANNGPFPASILRPAVKTFLNSSPQIIRLGDHHGYERFTTHRVLTLERQWLKLIEQAKFTKGAYVPDTAVEAALRATPQISAQHTAAVRYLLQGPRSDGTQPIRLVTGIAGSGKTTAIKAAVDALKSAGKHVICASRNGIAVQTLQRATGHDPKRCVTTSRLLWDLGVGRKLFDVKHAAHMMSRAASGKTTWKVDRLRITKKSVVLIDEAAVLGTEALTRIAAKVAKKNATLILVGDSAQTQPIQHGNPVAYAEKHLPTATIATIVRQTSQADRTNVALLREGKAATVLENYKARGLLCVAEHQKALKRKLITEWSKNGAYSPSENLILAPTNQDRASLNRLAQSRRRALGLLGDKTLSLPTGVKIHEKDFVVFRSPKLRHYGVENGTRATVLKINKLRRSIRIQTTRGQRIDLPIAEVRKCMELSYCLSIHLSQSMTVSGTTHIYFGGPIRSRELAYVAASRARTESRIYVAASGLPELASDLSRSKQKQLAHEYAREGMTHTLSR
jgi:conjugative relaxase-like TrwC/TraI family protein